MDWKIIVELISLAPFGLLCLGGLVVETGNMLDAIRAERRR